jgi:hypothetical protein
VFAFGVVFVFLSAFVSAFGSTFAFVFVFLFVIAFATLSVFLLAPPFSPVLVLVL